MSDETIYCDGAGKAARWENRADLLGSFFSSLTLEEIDEIKKWAKAFPMVSGNGALPTHDPAPGPIDRSGPEAPRSSHKKRPRVTIPVENERESGREEALEGDDGTDDEPLIQGLGTHTVVIDDYSHLLVSPREDDGSSRRSDHE